MLDDSLISLGILAAMVAILVLASLQAQSAVRLQDLDLSLMYQEWGTPQKAMSVDKHPLKIAGKTYEHGVGSHSNSEIRIALNGQATRFTAEVGLDDEVERSGTIRFIVYLDGKKKVETPVMRKGDPARKIDLDLRKAKTMNLIVDDAGDTIDYDHGDWALATIEYSGRAPAAIKLPPTPPAKIARIDANEARINGPRVVGSTPGRPFLFKIPATGIDANTVYTATGLPPGVFLDEKTGIIEGKIERDGTWNARVGFKGRKSASRELKIVAGKDKLALTPPMGWNSWNVWGVAVDADKVRAAADSFVKAGLDKYGYSYVNIDDAWEGTRSATGEIQTNDKFGDMGALADYVHSLGLKLGIYSSPGPRTCAGFLGSYEHEEQDAKTYATWGIDYLKHDWCSYGQLFPNPTLQEMKDPYIKMKSALDNSGRDIVYSLCQYGMGDVYKWGKEVGGNLWRTTGDIFDTWSSMSNIGFQHSEKAIGVTPGGWNDPDMLVVGYLGWGPNPRPTRLTQHEQVTHITLWSMLAAPLILGCDLTRLDPFTKDLITNPEVLDVDQDPLGKPATRKLKEGDVEVWTRPLFDGTHAVAIFNRGREAADVNISFAKLGLNGRYQVRDLWMRKDLASAGEGYRGKIERHGAVMLKLRV